MVGTVKGKTSGKTRRILADRLPGPTLRLDAIPRRNQRPHEGFPQMMRKLRLETPAQLRQILDLDAQQGAVPGQATG
jgi:hypothetical protein